MIEHAISDFGQKVGLANLRFDDEGIICLSHETTEVYIERIDKGALAYIVQEVSYTDADTYCALMAICNYTNKSVAYVNPGITQDGKLMLSMRFEEEEASGQMIHKGLLFLQSQMQSLTK